MLEVSYQLKDSTILDLVIGSEGFTLNSGWPYKEILARLGRAKDMDPVKLAHVVVDEYIRFYQEYYLGGLSVDMSILKLGQIEPLREMIDELAELLIKQFNRESPLPRTQSQEEDESEEDGQFDPTGKKPFQDAILLSHWAAQSYNGEQCVDLYDFCELLAVRCGKSTDGTRDDEIVDPISKACQNVIDLIANVQYPLILKSCYSGAAFQHSHGVSIYFPWSDADFDPTYKSLYFGRRSKWIKFLKRYLKATKVRRRNANEIRVGPPYSKGPLARVHSMRNPPTRFSLDSCPTEGKHDRLPQG
jgi:hypothetical protein